MNATRLSLSGSGRVLLGAPNLRDRHPVVVVPVAPHDATLDRRHPRLATSARRLTLHLPTGWPWEHAWQRMIAAATGPPL